MKISNYQYFLLFVSSLTLVGLLTPVMRIIAIKKKIYDLPNSTHKSHLIPTPYLGGVAIILGISLVLLAAIVFAPITIDNLYTMLSVLIPALVLGLIGLWDDIKGLPALPRLLGQSLVGVIISTLLINTGTVGNPTGSSLLDILLTVFWIVGICNSINFFDNMDGGAAGTVAFSSAGLAFLAWYEDQSLIAALALITAGATLGFLLWNKSPAKIYMGDTGALFLGVLIASLAIRLDPSADNKVISLSVPLLLLAIPILDTTVVVISRLLRGISILEGGQDHLSHRLVIKGFTRKKSVIILWLLSIIFVILAISIVVFPFQFTVLVLLLIAIIWLFLLFFFLKIPIAIKK